MEDCWKIETMIEEIYFHTTNADGREIHGKYRAGPNVIMVTLSDGRSKRVHRDYRMSVEDQAKFMLRELDRKSRGKS